MTRWEYLQLHATFKDGQMLPYLVNGQLIPDWQRGPNVFDYLNQLGNAGWEVVAVAGGGDDPVEPYVYFLKRPKQ